jgi:hypothetical protein
MYTSVMVSWVYQAQVYEDECEGGLEEGGVAGRWSDLNQLSAARSRSNISRGAWKAAAVDASAAVP